MKNAVQYAMMRFFPIAFLLLTVSVALGGGKRTPLLVSVHLESDSVAGAQFVFPIPIPGSDTTRYFKKSAEITDRELEWFYLFPAENGNGFGAAFKFNSVGTNRLEYISSSNQGRHLLISAHPGVSSFVQIDKVISDGVVVIWGGLTQDHVAQLRKYLQERTAAAPSPEAEPADNDQSAPSPAPEKKKRKLFR